MVSTKLEATPVACTVVCFVNWKQEEVIYLWFSIETWMHLTQPKTPEIDKMWSWYIEIYGNASHTA